MGKSGRCYREPGRKSRNDYWADAKNQNDNAYDSVMDMYEHPLEYSNERYESDDVNEDDDWKKIS